MEEKSLDNFDDEARDEAYFSLFLELESQNISRYEQQAKEIIKQKTLVLQVDNLWVKYSLDRYGCSCEISRDAGMTFSDHSWSRLGWSNRKKEKSLPTFFAQTETDVKFGLGN